MKAAKMCTSGVVVIQFLMLLSNIDIVKAKDEPFMACETGYVEDNTLKCEKEEKPMICITSVSIAITGQDRCERVPDATPNSNCSEELVKKYVLKKCNGKKNCIIFERYIEISLYCEKAIKYVAMPYECVSSPSDCKTLPSISNNTRAPTEISPTKTTKTRTTINENRHPTSPLSEIPATTAQEPGNEISRNYSSLVPMLTRHAPNSRKKSITCAPKTTRKNMATISPQISSTKLPLVKRNAGHSVLKTCFIHLKVHVMVFASFIVFSLL